MQGATDWRGNTFGTLCACDERLSCRPAHCQGELPMSKENLSPRFGRRRFLALAGVTAGAAIIAQASSSAGGPTELPHLSPDDPLAVAEGYVEDSSKVDQARFPNHTPAQACVNCNLYPGPPDGFGPCPIFPGKAVSPAGWCAKYQKES